jgi:hypothetical protein
MVPQKKLKLDLGNPQTAKIRVGSQIVEHLSKGIYTNPAQAIKELIMNAYDADATKVIVRTRPEFDTLTISDNGTGMNYEDFNERFLTLSRSDRRDSGEFTSVLKRPIVGKFGIGFVAVSQICDKMTVISSKKGEPVKLEAEINFSKFRQIEHIKKDFYDLSEVSFINNKEDIEAKYTIVVLSNLLDGIWEHFVDKSRQDLGIKTTELKALSFTGILDYIVQQASKYQSKFDPNKKLGEYWQMLLEIANIVPVRYLNKGPIRFPKRGKKTKEQSLLIQEIIDDVNSLDFIVDFDGVLLRKPIHLPVYVKSLRRKPLFDVFTFRENFSFADGTSLRFRGYLYNQDSSIFPPQMRGILIRIKNTAIGTTDAGFMDYVFTEKMYLNWTFGEIYVDEGLEDAMNISRSSFNTAHPHYQKLRDYLHSLLHNEVFKRSRERYTKRKTAESRRELSDITSELEERFSEAVGHAIAVDWSTEKSPIPIEFQRSSGVVRIYTSHPIFRKLRKQQRIMLQTLLMLLLESYEISNGQAKELFSHFLQALDDWDFRR